MAQIQGDQNKGFSAVDPRPSPLHSEENKEVSRTETGNTGGGGPPQLEKAVDKAPKAGSPQNSKLKTAEGTQLPSWTWDKALRPVTGRAPSPGARLQQGLPWWPRDTRTVLSSSFKYRARSALGGGHKGACPPWCAPGIFSLPRTGRRTRARTRLRQTATSSCFPNVDGGKTFAPEFSQD